MHELMHCLDALGARASTNQDELEKWHGLLRLDRIIR